MSTFRKAIVLILLGLLVGVGLGVGFIAWRKSGFFVPGYGKLAQEQIEGLTATCSGGATPIVLITWPSELAPYVSGLERSVGGASWQPVSVPARTYGQGHTVDTGLISDTLYLYRVTLNGLQISNIAQVTTDLASCTTK